MTKEHCKGNAEEDEGGNSSVNDESTAQYNENDEPVKQTAPKKKKLKQALVIAGVALAEVIVILGAFVGGFFAGRSSAPSGNEIRDYQTYADIIEYYTPSSADMGKSVADFTDNFSLYKRVYYTLLSFDGGINVKTSGKTDSLSVVVNINNLKKRKGDRMYMETLSQGASSSLSKMTDNHIKAYFAIDYEDSRNTFIKVANILHPSEDDFVEQTELRYVANFGFVTYAFCGYVITPETIQTSQLTEEEGLNKLTLNLDPVASTVNMVVQMKTLAGGSESDYSGGKVEYIVYFGDDFKIVKVVINEKYKVDYGVKVTCNSTITDTYAYEGENEYEDIKAEENYDNVGKQA